MKGARAAAGPLHYRVRWKPSGLHPGANGGSQPGNGQRLRSLVPLRDHPDPRRLDLLASARDPLQRLWVRDFHLNAALKVVLLVDLSASMGFVGAVDRMDVVRDIAAQLALSAWRSGDAFGLYGAAEQPRADVQLPPRVNRGAWLWVKRRLASVQPAGSSAAGLATLVPRLPLRRALVFIISDFRWPAGQLPRLLKSLAHHDVVPLVLQDATEHAAMPSRGLAMLRDAETGATRFAWLRPDLLQAVQAARDSHWKGLVVDCRLIGSQPFLVRGAFDPLALSSHFEGRWL